MDLSNLPNLDQYVKSYYNKHVYRYIAQKKTKIYLPKDISNEMATRLESYIKKIYSNVKLVNPHYNSVVYIEVDYDSLVSTRNMVPKSKSRKPKLKSASESIDTQVKVTDGNIKSKKSEESKSGTKIRVEPSKSITGNSSKEIQSSLENSQDRN